MGVPCDELEFVSWLEDCSSGADSSLSSEAADEPSIVCVANAAKCVSTLAWLGAAAWHMNGVRACGARA